jgi:ABC-type bacteriocin/lantibiotic exporter with double-glycine peptidase domain
MSLLDLKDLCADFGLPTEVRRCSTADLRALRYPIIAHVRFDLRHEGHYVVVTRLVDQDRIEAIDGTTAERELYYIEKMSNISNGFVLLPTGRTSLMPSPSVIITIAVVVFAGGVLARRWSGIV